MAAARNRFCVALLVLASCGVLHAQTAANQFVPFGDFVQKTEAATSDVYMAHDSRVKDAAAFEKMRQYILTMYQGVHVGHSFVRDNNHVDCVPVMEQPSVRLLGLTEIASEPPNERLLSNGSTGDSLAGEPPVALTSQFDPEQPFDEFGNAMI